MTFSVKVNFKNNFDEKRPDLLFFWLFWEVSFEGDWDEEKYVFVKMDNSLILAPLTWEKNMESKGWLSNSGIKLTKYP